MSEEEICKGFAPDRGPVLQPSPEHGPVRVDQGSFRVWVG